jgi:hypothetical protein
LSRILSKKKYYFYPPQAPIEAKLRMGQAAGLSNGVKVYCKFPDSQILPELRKATFISYMHITAHNEYTE